jgi:hypothetical protein
MNISPKLYKEQEYAINFVLKRIFRFLQPPQKSLFTRIYACTPIKG